MEKPDEKQGLKELIKFLNSEEGKPLVKSAIKVLCGDGDNSNKIKIDSFDKFFDIEYEIIKAILNPGFKDKLKNNDIIDQFPDAKSELENLKNDNQMKNELSSLIVTSIDMGIILNNLATNCKAGQNKSIGSGDQNQKESIEFINICRIINRLIDNEYNYRAKEFPGAFCWPGNEDEKLKMVVVFVRIFDYESYKIFWEYVAKIPNIESFIDKLNNQDTKFENEECKKLHERFLKYKEPRGEILKNNAAEIFKVSQSRPVRPVYVAELTIGEDGALSPIKEVYPKSEQDYDRIANINKNIGEDGALNPIKEAYPKSEQDYDGIANINDKKPFSFWKILSLGGISVAFGCTGFFGSNSAFGFIAVVPNPLSIIIALVALVALSILLVVAHKTGAFKVGKVVCCGKYENDSWFYLRQGKEHENEPEINTNDLEMEKTNYESEDLLN